MNPDNKAGPLQDFLGDLPEVFSARAGHCIEEMVVFERRNYDMYSNWKIAGENWMDPYHVPTIHKALEKFSSLDDHHPHQGPGRYVGILTHPAQDCDSPLDSDKFLPTPRSTEFESKSIHFYFIYPNVGITIYPHCTYTLLLLPGKHPEEHKQVLTLLQHPKCKLPTDSKEEHKNKLSEVMEFVCNVNDEDASVVNKLAQGMRQDAYDGGPFHITEEHTLHNYQKMVMEAVMKIYEKKHAKPI